MKAHTIDVAFLILVVLAAACAGCTGQPAATAAGNSVQETQQPVAAAETTPSAASPQQVGSTVSSKSIFGSGYSWMEYKTTSSYNGNQMTTDTKTERSTGDYKGTPAVHLRMTTTSSGGMTSVYDIYYDTAMKTVLGGTMTMTVNGQTTTQDVPASQLQSQQGGNFNSDYSMTFAGIEPVTVPAGKYAAASKYTASRNNIAMTYWAVSGVPVPVKYMSTSSQGSSTAELVGWG